MSKLAPKYRPYLSLEEIEYLLQKIEPDAPTNPLVRSIHKSLKSLQIKATVGIATGSYTPTPRKSVAESLGFTPSSEEDSRYLAGEMAPEEEAAYLERLMKTEGV